MRHIGLIADTHGLLRPAAIDALQGCDHIIHAGDIGNPAILAALSDIAPVTAVRGNNDRAGWAVDLQEVEILQLESIALYVIHDLKQLPAAPGTLGVQVVIAGHSHRPGCERRDGILFINPGSAGPRRFKLPVSAARLTIDGSTVTPHLLALE